MTNSKRLIALAVSAALGAPLAAHATNGMDMAGYGPIATGMGGASMAYDNGTAAMMNNPATLGLMGQGNRLDLAVGVLGPDVKTKAGGTTFSSQADSFLMPAAGWAHKSGKLVYGVGAFAQGGMGTQYAAPGPGTSSILGNYTISDTLGAKSTVEGWRERSEVGVMRILFPLAYQPNDKLTLGGSLDFVRATMDIQWAMPGFMMQPMMAPGGNSVGSLSGSMVTALSGMMGANPGQISAMYGGYFNFSDNNPFNGKTSATGWAGKLGFTYKVTPDLTIGGTYQSKTSLGDLTGNATVSMAVNINGAGDMVMPVAGKIHIKDFQWPQTWGLGMAYQATNRLMVAADVKLINWKDVMKDFKMSFTAAGNTGSTAGFNGSVLDATLHQNWKDQTVFELGGAYKATDHLTVRAGVNLANNPVPDSTVNYLFPAIVQDHYMVGLGYQFNKTNVVNASLTFVPKVTVTGSNPLSNQGVIVSHSQTNWQLMYSHMF